MDARVNLPLRLKSATRELHARAERSGVMADLLARRISRETYVALLANLHAIYAAMEAALEAERRPARFEALARTAALASDLRAFGAAALSQPVPATLDYVARLRKLRGSKAHRLWAHLYVRCLGDLHGGQMMGPLVRDLFAIADSTRFYDFGSGDDVRSLRESLRAQLGSLGLDARREDEVVAEAVWAFEAHVALFEQLRTRVTAGQQRP